MRLLVAVLLLCSCARSASTGSFIDLEKLARARPDDDSRAVVLHKSDRLEVHLGGGRFTFTEYRHHRVVQVLAEDGIESASVRIRHPEKAEIVELRGRSIAPDGTIVELQPEGVLEETLSEDAEGTMKVKVWRIPGVKVGSLVETAYTMRVAGSWASSSSEYPAEDIPVRHYEVELLLSKKIRYALRKYNSDVPIEQSTQGDYNRFTWTLKDIPALESRAAGPDWSAVSPWWIYRAKQVVVGSWVQDVQKTWADALGNPAVKLSLSSDLYDEPPPELGTGCADVRCRIEAARAEARRIPLYKKGSLNGARKISAIRASGQATWTEKVLVLLHAMAGAKVLARPAVLAEQYGRRADPLFPWPAYWEKAVVYVLPQPGLEEGLWIDPICESCATGQLSPAIEGVEAWVLEAEPRLKNDTRVTVQRLPVLGARPEVGVEGQTWRFRVDDSGKISGTVTLVSTHHNAVWWPSHVRGRSSSDWDRTGREFLTEREATARLTSAPPASCTERVESCSRTIDFEIDAYATASTERLVLPLSLFRSDWDGLFARRKRDLPLVFRRPSREEQEVVIEVPPGWAVSSLPEARVAEAPGLRSEIEARPVGGNVVVRRVLAVTPGIHEVATYPAHRTALQDFTSASKDTVVLTRAK